MSNFGERFGRLVRIRRGIEGLTQEALAERAFGDAQRKSRISDLENGRIRNPQQRTVDALAVALGISPDELEACIGTKRDLVSALDTPMVTVESPAQTKPDDAMPRREFVVGAAGSMVIAAMPWLCMLNDGTPTNAIASVTVAYRSMEACTPSRQLIQPVNAHFAFARQRTKACGTDGTISTAAWAALSETAGLAAWLHMDLCDFQAAREHYRLAIAYATQSRHELLKPYMTGSLSQLAIELDDPQQAIHFAQQARQQLPLHAPDIAHAWTLTMEAMARASAGDALRAMRGLDKAEEVIARAEEGPPPAWPWLFKFDHAKIQGYRTLILARDGKIGSVRNIPLGASASKQQALRMIAFARGLLRQNDTDEACRLASQALVIGRRLQSERVIRHALKFRDKLPDSRSPEVQQFMGTLAEIYS